jgi:hypothetical protein
VEEEALRGRAALAGGAPAGCLLSREVCANYENYAYLTTV